MTPFLILCGLYMGIIVHEFGHAIMYRNQDFMITAIEIGFPSYGRTKAIGDVSIAEVGLIAMAGFSINLLMCAVGVLIFLLGFREGVLLALTQLVIASSALFPSADLRMCLDAISKSECNTATCSIQGTREKG